MDPSVQSVSKLVLTSTLVASPVPIEVVEWAQVKALLRDKQVVIACGGGGIPVARAAGSLHGVEAVIDKDLAAALPRPCSC